MPRFTVILLSFLSAVTVMAQNDGLESINAEIEETITAPQYDFAPDTDSPNVEVAPLAVNAQDQDVPLQPSVSENINIDVNETENNNQK